jgi:hypothetical protein
VCWPCCGSHARSLCHGMCCTQGAASDASSAASSASTSSSMADVQQQLGVSPEELMQRLISRPDVLAKVQDPEVGRSECWPLIPRQALCRLRAVYPPLCFVEANACARALTTWSGGVCRSRML